MARTTKDPKGCSLGIRVNKKTEVWLREQSALYGMNKSEYVRAVLDSMARNEKKSSSKPNLYSILREMGLSEEQAYEMTGRVYTLGKQ